MLASFDAVLLARIQFAFTVSFHFLFPAFTIGLASYLAVLNGLYLWTRQHKYLELFRYWVKIFALAFAMGVVSGIVMSYQFGTNWSVFSDRTGPVLGAPMAYEVLSAFFLEAGFLGIMLFGRDRVGPGLHMAACAASPSARSSPPSGSCRSTRGCTRRGRLRDRPRDGAVPADRLLADRLQPLLPLPPGPHGDRRLPDHRLHRGRRRRVAPAAPPPQGRARVGRDAHHVLHGHVDGRPRRPGADRAGRPARAQHDGAPAAEGDGDGGALRELPRRRAASTSSASPTTRPRRSTTPSASPSCRVSFSATT